MKRKEVVQYVLSGFVWFCFLHMCPVVGLYSSAYTKDDRDVVVWLVFLVLGSLLWIIGMVLGINQYRR